MNSLTKSFKKWVQVEDQRLALQRLYLSLAVLSLASASLIGLINYSLGQQILIITLASSGVFLINAIAWALWSTLSENLFGSSISTPPRSTAKKSKK